VISMLNHGQIAHSGFKVTGRVLLVRIHIIRNMTQVLARLCTNWQIGKINRGFGVVVDTYKLIFLDIRMSNASGFRLLGQIPCRVLPTFRAVLRSTVFHFCGVGASPNVVDECMIP
jgi:hypothetical protein